MSRIELLASARPLRHGARVRVHPRHDGNLCADFGGRHACQPKARHGRPQRPVTRSSIVPAGGDALARLRLEQPGVLTRGDRFVIRSASPVVTVGGGVVLDPDRAGRRTAAHRGRAFCTTRC
jgi:selenocysteine-specific elongation factor